MSGRYELQGVACSWRAANGVQIRPSAVKFDRHTSLLMSHLPGANLFASSSNGRLSMWADHRLGLCFAASLALADHSAVLRAVRDRTLASCSIMLPSDRVSHFEDGLEIVDSTGIDEISLAASGTALDPYTAVWSEFCGDPDDPTLGYWQRDMIDGWRARRPANDNRIPAGARIAAHGRRHPGHELLARIDAIIAGRPPVPRR
jgi:hypothetical protein